MRPEAKGADPGCVQAFEDPPFEIGIYRIGVATPDAAQNRPLGIHERDIGRPPDTDTEKQRRARVRSGFDNTRLDMVDYFFRGDGRPEHLQESHVFRTAAFQVYRNADSIAGNYLRVKETGSIGSRIFTYQGIADHRFAQVQTFVGIAHARVNRIAQIVPLERHILPDVAEDDRHAAVLAQRKPVGRGNARVLDKHAQRVPCRIGLLPVPHGRIQIHDPGRHCKAGPVHQSRHRAADKVHRNGTLRRHPVSPPRRRRSWRGDTRPMRPLSRGRIRDRASRSRIRRV